MATKQKNDEVASRRTTSHITVATIAAHMGLSRATITHVLNGRAEEQRIRPETKRRVLEVARDLGYRSNASARAIRSGRFGNIALVQSLLGQYLPSELLYGLTKAIADKDMHLVLTEVPDVVIEDESYLPHTMRELSVDGVLVNRLIGSSQPFVDRIHKLRIPAIFLNVQQEFDCIHPDDLMGGRMATEYLLRLGHERITYVGAIQLETEHYSERDRRSGYEQVMISAGKTPWVYPLPVRWPHDWRTPGQERMDTRVAAAKALLAREDRPTAVLAYELGEATAIVHAAYQLGVRIPEDLSIILFHNTIDYRYCIPFHTVSNVMEKLGKDAVAMLLEKINAPEVSIPTRAVPVVLLEGATCLPLRTQS